MSTLAPDRADEIIEGWLKGIEPIDGWQNPAGPLFVSGKYAESDITMTGGGGTTHCGWCTGSITLECY